DDEVDGGWVEAGRREVLRETAEVGPEAEPGIDQRQAVAGVDRIGVDEGSDRPLRRQGGLAEQSRGLLRLSLRLREQVRLKAERAVRDRRDRERAKLEAVDGRRLR